MHKSCSEHVRHLTITSFTRHLHFVCTYCLITVARMVKYTGYGNCAGLLANRGLLLGGKTDGNYSSNSDDSETEEYSQLKER